MNLRDRLRAALTRHPATEMPPQPRIVVGIDPAAHGRPEDLVIACEDPAGRIRLLTQVATPLVPFIPVDLWDAAAERQAIDEYQAEIRRQRFLGRMHVLQLADDAWARYGWTRPKAVRR